MNRHHSLATTCNAKTGLRVASPVTDQVKSYPFEVELLEGWPEQGAVLSGHQESADWPS